MILLGYDHYDFVMFEDFEGKTKLQYDSCNIK